MDYGYKIGDRVKSIFPLAGRKFITGVAEEFLPNGKVKVRKSDYSDYEFVMWDTIEKWEEQDRGV
jgi:hypothetical protein